MEPVAIFLAISLGSLAILFALSERLAPDRSRIRRRLQGEFVGAGASATAANLYKDADSWEPEFDADAAAAQSQTAFADRAAWSRRYRRHLREAGLDPTPRQLIGVAVGLTVLPFAVGLLASGWIAAVAGLSLGVFLPIAAIAARRKNRRERYIKQLAGAFELMARVLRTGKSVTESFRAAVDAFEDPLSAEFGRSLHEIEHGLRPEDAFRELSERSGVLELRIFVVAMAIQRQTGGNLAEMLDRLASIVRNRILVRKKLSALTAEGRMQSLCLVVLPFLTFGVMYVLNRAYAEKLLENWRLLAATIGCMGIGMAWIRNIMKFEY